MSINKTIKRIALVAVSALGFGLLSAVPARAVVGDITGGVVTVTTASIVPEPVDAFKLPFSITTTAQIANATTVGLVVTVTAAPTGATLTCSKTSGGAFAANNCTQANTEYEVLAAGAAADGKLRKSGAGAEELKTASGYIYAKVDKPGTYTITIGVVGLDGAGAALTRTSAAASFTLTSVDSGVTFTNSVLVLAGRVGQQMSIPITADIAANDLSAAPTGQYAVIGMAAAITAQPTVPSGQSVVYPVITSTAQGAAALAYDKTVTGDGTGSATNVATQYLATNLSDENVTAKTGLAVGTVTFTPVATGVHTLVVWNETSDTTSSLDGAESYQTFTINVTSTVSTVAISAVNSTCAMEVNASNADEYGCLLKITTKDAAGNLAVPAIGESVTLTPSGTGDISYVNTATVVSAAGAVYSLPASAFGNTGVAWVNVSNEVAETITLVATYTGSASASVNLTFRKLTNQATDLAPLPVGTSGFAGTAGAAAANGTVNYPRGSVTGTFLLDTVFAATTYSGVLITDTLGKITGTDGTASGFGADLKWAPAATVSTDTDGSGTDGALFSVSWTASSTADTANIFTIAEIDTTAGNARVRTISSIATAAGTATLSPATVNAVSGATSKLLATLKDNFGRALANTTMTASVTGRNPTAVPKTALTDALGMAEFSFTDANTTSVITSDTVTLTGGSAAKTATILYGAANAPSTVTLTSTGDTDVIPGTTTTDIDASATGATGTSATASAVVKNSAGSTVAGVPVTFTVTGLVGAEVHTTKVTVYTDTTGKAVSNISSYAAGKATVTATAGTATASDDIYFKQQTPAEARTIAVAAAGGLVTATVKDRYGNVIEGVAVNATRTGTGYFGSGASTATGNTDKNGKVEFNFTGTGTVTVAFSSATYGQSYAAAGYDFDAVNGTAITAYVAGTSATNQKGLGGSLSPAGINSASVAVTAADPAQTAADAAADAAAEAIDAANAATDAANLAAEAADAATVAAEEARDAADAATAAVQELATQVATLMAALKAQITTLANTVAKIAKKVKA